jgi:hypothetical protein
MRSAEVTKADFAKYTPQNSKIIPYSEINNSFQEKAKATVPFGVKGNYLDLSPYAQKTSNLNT